MVQLQLYEEISKASCFFPSEKSEMGYGRFRQKAPFQSSSFGPRAQRRFFNPNSSSANGM